MILNLLVIYLFYFILFAGYLFILFYFILFAGYLFILFYFILFYLSDEKQQVCA